MWLLFIVLAATASGQRNDIIDTSHLDLAMTGFDAWCVNSFIEPDPGRRSKLLQPLQTPINAPGDEVLVSQFIYEEEATKCSPKFSVQTAINYIELQKYATSSAYQLSNDVNSGPSSLRYDNSASCGTRSNFRDRDMKHFFKDTGGEVILVSAECVTRVITIAPFQPLTFTSEFETVLVNLYKAALNPASEISEKTFSDFVEYYGTHFSKRTHLGAKAIFGIRFPSRSATPDEQKTRRWCVLGAAREVLMSCTRWCDDTTLMRFARASSERCLAKEEEVFAAIKGPLPKGSLENWSSQAEELPDPIFQHLEPVTTLFDRDWMSSRPEVKNINKDTLRGYFGTKFADYTKKMLTGGFGQSQLKGCGLNSRCDPGAECIDEPDATSGHRCKTKDDAKPSPPTPTTPPPPTSTVPTTTTTAAPLQQDAKPSPPTPTTPPPPTSTVPTTTTAAPLQQGRIIIVGGCICDDSPATPYSMALFGPALPPFPVFVHGNSLSIVEDTVYSCGGYGSSNKCWASDARPIVGQTMAWRSIDLPWEIVYHSAVVVKNEIWFFLSSMLRIFDTRNPASKFREFQMEFSFGKVTCAVAHGTKTFVIGVGEENMEVYVNTDSSKPNQWDKFSRLLQGRGTFGCHVYRGEVFVTGGYVEATNTHLSSVEAISIVDGTVRSIGPLGGVRADHKMAIIEGRLAVLGGHKWIVAMATIETYDELKNSWETLGRTLGNPRFHFGLTQFLP